METGPARRTQSHASPSGAALATALAVVLTAPCALAQVAPVSGASAVPEAGLVPVRFESDRDPLQVRLLTTPVLFDRGFVRARAPRDPAAMPVMSCVTPCALFVAPGWSTFTINGEPGARRVQTRAFVIVDGMRARVHVGTYAQRAGGLGLLIGGGALAFAGGVEALLVALSHLASTGEGSAGFRDSVGIPYAFALGGLAAFAAGVAVLVPGALLLRAATGHARWTLGSARGLAGVSPSAEVTPGGAVGSLSAVF